MPQVVSRDREEYIILTEIRNPGTIICEGEKKKIYSYLNLVHLTGLCILRWRTSVSIANMHMDLIKFLDPAASALGIIGISTAVEKG